MRSRGGGSGVHGELTHRYRELLIARICHMKERSLPALPAPFTGQTLEVARLSMPVFLPRSRTSRQSFSRAVDGKVAGQDVMPYTSSPAPCPCPPAFPSPRAGGSLCPVCPSARVQSGAWPALSSVPCSGGPPGWPHQMRGLSQGELAHKWVWSLGVLFFAVISSA